MSQVKPEYASPLIPVPPVVHLGQFQGIHYGISRRLRGQGQDKLSPSEYREALPAVMETLYAIHQVDVSHETKYGWFNGEGVGREDRFLVHGGYGYGNLLIENGRVTGVLDWIDATYGDFVYDVAWLDYFRGDIKYPELYEQYAAERGLSIPSFRERLLCYQGFIGLDGLRFFAKTGDAAGYTWTRKRLLGIFT